MELSREKNNASLQGRVTRLFLLLTALFITVYPAVGYSANDDETAINEIFTTYGKENVINFISQKRNGRITIQKNRSFADTYGKPATSLITHRTILQDLKILHMSIADLDDELDAIKSEQERNNAENSPRETAALTTPPHTPLSVDLNKKIINLQKKYDQTDSVSERKKIRKELRILRRAYRDAKRNEQPRTVSTSKKTYNNDYATRRCNEAKDKLQQLTSPEFRHQVFFCNDRKYRSENPRTCGDATSTSYRYLRYRDRKLYTDDVNRARNRVKQVCKN